MYTEIAVISCWHKPQPSWRTPLFVVYLVHVICSSTSVQTQAHVQPQPWPPGHIKQWYPTPTRRGPPTFCHPQSLQVVDHLPPCNLRPEYHHSCHSLCRLLPVARDFVPIIMPAFHNWARIVCEIVAGRLFPQAASVVLVRKSEVGSGLGPVHTELSHAWDAR
jgi:hypothetical protein